mmetsp:Transcript_7399/g.24553  ORF Transcript_7399/g.24553 Transcript_7399/m.24553 type:complete len:449 (+) Transcript_7399:1425-2771(+)
MSRAETEGSALRTASSELQTLAAELANGRSRFSLPAAVDGRQLEQQPQRTSADSEGEHAAAMEAGPVASGGGDAQISSLRANLQRIASQHIAKLPSVVAEPVLIATLKAWAQRVREEQRRRRQLLASASTSATSQEVSAPLADLAGPPPIASAISVGESGEGETRWWQPSSRVAVAFALELDFKKRRFVASRGIRAGVGLVSVSREEQLAQGEYHLPGPLQELGSHIPPVRSAVVAKLRRAFMRAMQVIRSARRNINVDFQLRRSERRNSHDLAESFRLPQPELSVHEVYPPSVSSHGAGSARAPSSAADSSEGDDASEHAELDKTTDTEDDTYTAYTALESMGSPATASEDDGTPLSPPMSLTQTMSSSVDQPLFSPLRTSTTPPPTIARRGLYETEAAQQLSAELRLLRELAGAGSGGSAAAAAYARESKRAATTIAPQPPPPLVE